MNFELYTTVGKHIEIIWLFMPPYRKIGGILFYCCPSVRPSVCLHKLNMKTTFSHYSKSNLVTWLIFSMTAHLIDTHVLVPRSRSSAKVKVKYQVHVSQKMGVSGALVFHKHILFYQLTPSFSLLTKNTNLMDQ